MKEFEVAIVGGGPAGLAAGIWLGRYLRRVVLIDGGDPRNWETRGVNGYLGLPGVRPSELRGRGRDECRRFGVELIDDCVEGVSRDGERFRLSLSGHDDVGADRLLLSFGIRDCWPDVPGLEHAYGESAHVCPDCDGYEARGKKTLVIGAGKKAAGMALALTTWTDQVIICTNGGIADIEPAINAKLEKLNIPVLESRIGHISSRDGDVRMVQLEDGMQLDCERVFFTLGQLPADNLGTQLRCERDDHGLIEVDHRGATSVEHVFAAGDIVPGPQLAITAAASGAVAAMAIHRSLLPEHRRLD